MLHQSLDVLSPDEFEVLLDGTIEAALVMLRKLAAEESGAADTLLNAAKALIEARFQDAELSPVGMARGLGCSRAVLYRAFAHAGLTVVGYLREVRFRHFLEALARGARHRCRGWPTIAASRPARRTSPSCSSAPTG